MVDPNGKDAAGFPLPAGIVVEAGAAAEAGAGFEGLAASPLAAEPTLVILSLARFLRRSGSIAQYGNPWGISRENAFFPLLQDIRAQQAAAAQWQRAQRESYARNLVEEGSLSEQEAGDYVQTGQLFISRPGKIKPGETKESEFKEITKVEYDKLTHAQRQEYLGLWMKANNRDRIFLSEKHHAWPEYLGGPANQPLLSLDLFKHNKFHKLLDSVLPRNRATAFYAAKTPAQKIADIATLRRVARDFDLVEHTKISEQLNKVLKGTPYENLPF
jgi:hypothetical protein